MRSFDLNKDSSHETGEREVPWFWWKMWKRYAKTKLETLPLELPIFTWEKTGDPVKMNAVFSEKEWSMDSPIAGVHRGCGERIHWYACDPSSQSYFEIFFERLQAVNEGMVNLWVKLGVGIRRFALKQSTYMDNSAGHVYSAGGIRLECLAPMRRWRLAVNAIMEDSEGSKVHVRLGAQVAMIGHTFEIPKQLRPSFIASHLIYEEGVDYEIKKCCRAWQAITQPVSIFAELFLDGEKQQMLLFGSRLKLKVYEGSSPLDGAYIYVGYAENGTTYTAFETRYRDKAYGYCCSAGGSVQPIRKGRWGGVHQQEGYLKIRRSLSARIGDRHLTFSLRSVDVTTIGDGEGNRDKWLVGELVGTLIGEKQNSKYMGTVFRIGDFHRPSEEARQLLQVPRFPGGESHNFVLSTTDAYCKNSKLTGGKASSLAVLSELSGHLGTFTVPSAVVLTVDAYKVFRETAEVCGAIESLVQGCRSAHMDQLRTEAERCVSAISNSSLPESISHQVTTKLAEVFGNEWKSKKFAVRSSAVGEDSEEMSAAGQMTTFLGIHGERALSSSIVNCWASQFALTAINYKRQYGQELDGLMAVVVQEMVSADCAGVMFTCDPITSNPSSILITANFGLGESVVSGTADPDTYTLERDFGDDRMKIVIKSKTCGAKDRMVVESNLVEGTEERNTDADKARSFCLTDDQAVEIATIGAVLSEIMGTPRDIEWAVRNNCIHLLQSRPVTSFLRESDYEIRHDLNGALHTNREILSRANLDEVMPGVFSPLGISTFSHLVFETFMKTGFSEIMSSDFETSQFTYMALLCLGKKSFMNYSMNPYSKSETFTENVAVTMFGYDPSGEEAMQKGVVHEKRASLRVGAVKWFWKNLRGVEAKLERGQREVEDLRLLEEGDSLELFLSALTVIPKLLQLQVPMTASVMMASFYNSLTLNLLKKSQGEEKNTPEIMVLLSKILRSDYEIESAQIPKELRALSDLLREDPDAERFRTWTPEEALSWLKNNDRKAAQEFRTFLKKNAHRCYKEFDIHSKTWDLDPIPLVQTLQSNMKSDQPAFQESDVNTMSVDELPKRPNFLQRKLLNYFIPKTKFAVFMREASKSGVLKGLHRVRLSMWRLGRQLQLEGRLPDPELVFFLTWDELYRLITTRDPSLLPRAIRRHKMHPALDKESFPSLLYGMPKPLDSSSIKIDPNAQSMKGSPVSGGLVAGPARVIKDFLTEAHLIKKGDILITRATDTGWTPYFPLLGGVVTEIGGLLSHGAVVAREYGLPAIVGIRGVTEFVESGEMVTLDGDHGVLHKSAAPES